MTLSTTGRMALALGSVVLMRSCFTSAVTKFLHTQYQQRMTNKTATHNTSHGLPEVADKALLYRIKARRCLLGRPKRGSFMFDVYLLTPTHSSHYFDYYLLTIWQNGDSQLTFVLCFKQTSSKAKQQQRCVCLCKCNQPLPFRSCQSLQCF